MMAFCIVPFVRYDSVCKHSVQLTEKILLKKFSKSLTITDEFCNAKNAQCRKIFIIFRHLKHTASRPRLLPSSAFYSAQAYK